MFLSRDICFRERKKKTVGKTDRPSERQRERKRDIIFKRIRERKSNLFL